jgi:hypothetical protein
MMILFVKLAESYGHIGIKVEKEQDLKEFPIEQKLDFVNHPYLFKTSLYK